MTDENLISEKAEAYMIYQSAPPQMYDDAQPLGGQFALLLLIIALAAILAAWTVPPPDHPRRRKTDRKI